MSWSVHGRLVAGGYFSILGVRDDGVFDYKKRKFEVYDVVDGRVKRLGMLGYNC